jgi:Holliday junction resolvase
MNSRQKGARGEREFRDQLRAAGYMSARRGQQFAGGTDSPDVVCDELAVIHWEVKRVERLNIEDAMSQAKRDSGSQKTPIVAHRKNGGEWLATVRLDDLFKLLRDGLDGLRLG